MSRYRVSRIRSLMKAISGSDKEKRLTTPNLVDIIKRDHALLVEEEKDYLIGLALSKLATSALTGRRFDPNQGELFSEYKIASRISVPSTSDDGSKREYIIMNDAPFRVLKEYLLSRSSPRKLSANDLELARAVEELEIYASSPESTLAMAFEEKKKFG
jgi:hypothetical protein